MKIKEITDYLESLAPHALQESYDNTGLITGNPEAVISAALVTVDVTEEVAEEAVEEAGAPEEAAPGAEKSTEKSQET